jgi:hypothetical protein
LLRRSADGRIDPAGQVQEIAPLVEAARERGIKAVYILDNEPNLLESDSRKAGIAQYCADLGNLIFAFRQAYRGTVALCSPPMAVMQDDLLWLDGIYNLMRAAEVEYRGAHIYWQGDAWHAPQWGHRLDIYARYMPGQRWIVDELGDATDDRNAADRATTTLYVLDSLAASVAVEAATVFIAGGTDQWRQFWLPPEELARIGQAMTAQWQPIPAIDPELPASKELEDAPPKPTKEDTPLLTDEQQKILVALDDSWGVLNKLEAAADQAKADAERIRAQIIAIKAAAGLNSPKA